MKNFVDGGEGILEAFRNLNIDYVMSSPGSEWGAVWEAFARQQVNGKDGPTYLSCWHETLAVNLATGYTAITGRPQAVLLHAGVGLLQGSMGIHMAQITETPMIVMSGESLTYGEQADFDPGHQWLSGLSVVGGPNRLVEPIVKWGNQATSPATLYESVMRAGEMAQRSPMGPAYLSVPIETMLHEWTPPAKMRNVQAPPKPRAAQEDIGKVAKLLADARHPVILTDTIGREPEGFAALVELAELLSIPVVEGPNANYTNLPKDHPLHQGFGIDAHRDEADLVLLVRSRVPWHPPSARPPKATIVAIDENPYKDYMVYQNLHADMFLEGDAPTSLRMLADAVRAAGVDAGIVEQRKAKWEAAHRKLEDGYRSAEAKARDSSAIDPIVLCAALGEALPDNTIYVDETITHRRVIQRHVPWSKPQSYFRVPGGLGQGLGTALGIKLAAPDRPVVSVIGDGSFLYNPVTQSIGLSMEAKLPILIVVFNNHGYQAMKNNQLSYYPDGAGFQNDIFLGHPINGPDYAELVQPFDGYGRRISDPAELVSAIRDCQVAVEDGKTAILNVELSR